MAAYLLVCTVLSSGLAFDMRKEDGNNFRMNGGCNTFHVYQDSRGLRSSETMIGCANPTHDFRIADLLRKTDRISGAKFLDKTGKPLAECEKQ